MSCSIHTSHSVVSSRSRICTNGQRKALALSASRSSAKKSSSRLSGTRIVSPLSAPAMSGHPRELGALRSQQLLEFGNAGAAIGAGTQRGADLRHSCQLFGADRGGECTVFHGDARGNPLASRGHPWFETGEQREPVFGLERLAKQPRRLFGLGKGRARRGEENASFQSAADQARVAKHSPIRI